MGGFFGIGGNESKVIKKGLGQSENVYNKALGLTDPLVADYNTSNKFGTGVVKSGLDTLGSSKDYFKTIMSGTRPEMMAAMAPELNAINETSDASRTGQATFGTQRGGGVNAANQAAETQRMTDINQAVFGARPAAAKEVERIGGTEAGIGTAEQEVGLKQLEAGLRALGLSDEAINNMTRNAIGSKQATTNAWKGLFDTLLGGGQLLKSA